MKRSDPVGPPEVSEAHRVAALTLRDPSGRQLILEHQEDGSVLAAISLTTFLRWSVRVPPEDVARLKEWLG